MPGLVAIVILNWNGWKDTIECLRSLRKLEYPDYHIILIDNRSTNNSVEMISPHLDTNVYLFQNKENLGFARGCNQGMIYAIEDLHADYICLLNNDTLVDRRFLATLVEKCEADDRIGMCSPKIFRMDDERHIDSTGHILKHGILYDRGSGDPPMTSYPCNVFGACAAAALYRTKMLKEIGLFREEYGTGYEDAELSWRAHNAGWKARYVPYSLVWHKRGASINSCDETRINFQSAMYHNIPDAVMRHGTLLQKLDFSAHWLFTASKSQVGKWLGYNSIGAGPYLKGYWEALKQ